ncbi:MAG: NPCBM/NEW2 domain-containing protein [Phycisphaerae bacterium]
MAAIGVVFARPATAQVDLEITRLDGGTLRGKLVEVAPQLVVQAGDGEVVLAWSEILGARVLAAQSAATTRDSGAVDPAQIDFPLRFELSDGSQFAARIERASESDLMLQIAGGASCRVELARVQSIRPKSIDETAARKLAALAIVPIEQQDTVVVARGAEVIPLQGLVRRIDDRQVTLFWKEREVSPTWDRIAAIVFARRTERGASSVVRLQNGDSLAGKIASGDLHALTLRSPVFDDLRIAWDQVERIECRSERVVPLSSLPLANYDFEPFFDKQWATSLDKSLFDKPISLAGKTYARGVCQHSRSAATFRLGGGYSQFAVTVGISDDVAPRGDAAVRIVGDGRVLWRADSIRGDRPPQDVAVDVTGVSELTLITDFGADLDLADHVCWGFARLIRS